MASNPLSPGYWQTFVAADWATELDLRAVSGAPKYPALYLHVYNSDTASQDLELVDESGVTSTLSIPPGGWPFPVNFRAYAIGDGTGADIEVTVVWPAGQPLING